MAGGVLPVMKHIPGHGRATADSHLDAAGRDGDARGAGGHRFRAVPRARDLPAAMTAHVVFTAIDRGSAGQHVAARDQEVIRGDIGFDGLLMSDDLGMKALSGSIARRAPSAVIAAGSDVVLQCNGGLAESEAVAAVVPALAGRALGPLRARPVPYCGKPAAVRGGRGGGALAEVLAAAGA